jgi:mannose-6-phosphate isomerase-like protein (cupin superfamily)
MTSWRLGWFGAGLAAGIAGTLLAVNGVATLVAAPPDTSRIVLENARVRVKEAVFLPGTPNPGMHTHDLPHVGVVIDGGTIVFRAPDGSKETMKLERGGVGYREANVTHEPVNVGDSPVRVIEVELK